MMRYTRNTENGIPRIISLAVCLPFLFTLCLLLAGCGPSVGPMAADLQPPRAALMVAPRALPDVPKGDDLVQAGNQCSAEYVRETGRLKSLQSYVRTVLKK